MSIATKIESISNHLKDAYENLEDIGIDLNDTNKNMINLPLVIKEVYNQWPKASGEGTSIDLNNTKKAKLKLQLQNSDIYQYTTIGKNNLKPSIETVVFNGITYTPVFNKNHTLAYINVNGTATGNSSYMMQETNRYSIDSSKSYIFNGCPKGGSQNTYSVLVEYYDENNTYLGGV